MKKTLITLAALAMASVASAATLDFTNLSGESTVTFGTPAWVNGGWDYSTGNTLTLDAATTINSANKTISDGTATVTYTNDVYDLFRLHDATATHDGPFTLSAGTINFGTAGSLTVNPQSGGLNLGEMGLKLNITLDTVVETDDADLLAAGTGVITRTFFTTSGQDVWNREGNNAAYTLNASALNGSNLTKVTDTVTNVGDWKLLNPTNNSIAVQYIVQYVAATPVAPAVPEPTTATLSLLALAGLAARRRRK